MLYELFVPSINFTSPTNFNHKQWKRSWYIMGTIRARKNIKGDYIDPINNVL